MIKKHTLFVAVLTIASSTIAKDSAIIKEPIQLAFVDSFKAMRDCTEGQKVGKKLDDMRDKFSKEIQQEAQRIAKEESDLKAKASALKPEVFAKEQRRIDKMKRELEDAVHEKEETIKLAMQQETESLAVKIEEGIIAVAKEKGVDAVIDKMTGRVMYTKEDNTGDITVAAIAFVDKKSVTVTAKKDDKLKAGNAAA